MYRLGEFETRKFVSRKESYYESLARMSELGYSQEDLLHHFPAFVGHMTLSRFLALYEIYKLVLGICGHIAEIGVYKGAGSLFFAKLTQIFEPESLTLVHGFDWFKGTEVTEEEALIEPGSYAADYDQLMGLIGAQNLGNVVHIHVLDVSTELGDFFNRHPYMQFKLVFVDAGTHAVVSSVLKYFWPRLVKGGVMVFDEYNHELGQGETRAVGEFMPEARIQTFPWAWMPRGYVVK